MRNRIAMYLTAAAEDTLGFLLGRPALALAGVMPLAGDGGGVRGGTLMAGAGIGSLVREIDTLIGELLLGKRKKDVEEEEEFDDEEEDDDEDDLEDDDEDDFDDDEDDEEFEEEFEDDDLDDDDDDIFYDDDDDE